MSLLKTLSFILNHPLNHRRKFRALGRYAAWQVGSRLAPGPVAVPFVNAARLLVSPSMTGATGNVYCGLHEYEDMAFLLHLLRPEDLFVDVGANIGSYTILASAAVGSKSIAIEPVPATFSRLIDNIRLNGAEGRVSTLNMGCGAEVGVLEFTSGFDTVNHVATSADESVAKLSVPVGTLDSIVSSGSPNVLKIDVEGYETEVLVGGMATLRDPALVAVIMELNGSGVRYGFDEKALHGSMIAAGFVPMAYAPRQRKLSLADGDESRSGNTIYVRDLDQVDKRLKSAPSFSVLGQLI